MRPVTIGDRAIGEEQPVYTIAEISGNHAGQLDIALQMIEAAHKAGADAIKIQVYRPDTITINSNKADFMIAEDNPWHSYGNLYNLFEYAHTPWQWLPALFSRANELGVELFGSVFDPTSVDELEKYHVRAYKIASPEVLDLPLLKKVAATGKPVILSTGLVNVAELAEAIATLKEAGCEEIVLLKCTTAYPTPISEVNLKTIPHLEQMFRLPVGLSDHTPGMGVSIGAVALGAKVIEKHIILDETIESVDSFFSLTIEQFQAMVTEIRRVEEALGDVEYSVTPAASKNLQGKRSLYAIAPIKAGEPFSAQNIKSVRPGFGLSPKYYDIVLSKKAAYDLEVGDPVTWDCLGGVQK
ncbi:pseudaminic acid synthase [Ectothiorhodospiraceae bacterium BW-2]|nr:pseudaminic acid synthase [Ectothiorhodospiraceae bacterium BW-2]